MSHSSSPAATPASLTDVAGPAPLSRAARVFVLVAAFLGWLFAGVQMSITPLVSNSATTDFLSGDAGPPVAGPVLTRWFSRYNATFLLGAAAGGLLFGWVGDRAGRSRALALSICCYTLFSAAAALAQTPWQFVAWRFLGCLGVGGAWPNGIALAVEVWHDVSKPVLAGIIGTAANVGLVLAGLVACYVKITPDSWRWVMLASGTPFLLGVGCLAWLPESPVWLATRAGPTVAAPRSPVSTVFRPPLLWLTLLGILLGAIPLFGGWGCTNWLVPWADQVGAVADPALKARTQVYRSVGAAITSLLGGWVSARLGRRSSYFLYSLASLGIGQHLYRDLDPTHPQFAIWVFLLGSTTGFYFGWLPLCLPEMFPTSVRSTGAGVTFNAGRIATALGVLGAGYLSGLPYFGGDYGKVGSVTSLVFALGMVAIWLLPRTPRTAEA
ncbi:MAG: MFS transporter [Pirellulales bacterium]